MHLRICFLGKRAGSIHTCPLFCQGGISSEQIWAYSSVPPNHCRGAFCFQGCLRFFGHLLQTEEPNVRNVISFLVCKKSKDKCQALLSTLLLLCLCCLTMVHMESKANCMSTGVQQEAILELGSESGARRPLPAATACAKAFITMSWKYSHPPTHKDWIEKVSYCRVTEIIKYKNKGCLI